MEFRDGAAVMMTWQISGSLHETLYMTKQKKKQMVSLGEGGRKLTWGFVDADAVKRQILKDTEDLQPDSAGTEGNASGEKDPTAAYAVRHLKSRILYPEAFQGVDIRYTIGPESLKEDLVLKQADAVSAFTWRYAGGGFAGRKKNGLHGKPFIKKLRASYLFLLRFSLQCAILMVRKPRKKGSDPHGHHKRKFAHEEADSGCLREAVSGKGL